MDLLLQLVEQEKLDISQVSLAAVADQFVSHIQRNPDIPLEELADFLVVAARLVYMKSKLLMPELQDNDLEEGPDLESQLRMYRAFIQVSRKIDARWKSKLRSFPRSRRPFRLQEVKFLPPPEVTSEVLRDIMGRIIARLEPFVNLPQAALERVVTVQDKIRQLFKRIKEKARLTFSSFLGRKVTKPEAVASFLALLELVKQWFVKARQTELFDEIIIEAHPEPPAQDPLAESYI